MQEKDMISLNLAVTPNLID